MESLLDLISQPLGAVCAVILVALVIAGAVFALRRPKRRPPIAPDAPASTLESEQDQGEETPAEPDAEAPTRAGPAAESVQEDREESADVPESLPSRMQRLRGRLAGSGGLGRALLSVLTRSDLGSADWEEIEDSLLMADLGLEATDSLMASLKTRVAVESASDPAAIRQILREELLTLVGPDMDRSLHIEARETPDGKNPATVLMVGVNGTGKTTTVGKLARVLVAQGKTVLLGAADTFRAAAAEQLGTWGQRVGVDVVRSDREGADPASVAFDAVRQGAERGVDVVLVDTAGRLQTKSTLMDELGKVKRVMSKQSPVDEVLLVLDATTGQNGLKQAEVFAEVAGVTGIVLTKLDGSAKGGIVVSVQRSLGVPVKFVGLGEGPADLAPFDPPGFVDAIIGA